MAAGEAVGGDDDAPFWRGDQRILGVTGTQAVAKRKEPETMVDAISHIAEDINRILDEGEKANYFYGIVLLYSFIENVLKWLVFTKTL